MNTKTSHKKYEHELNQIEHHYQNQLEHQIHKVTNQKQLNRQSKSLQQQQKSSATIDTQESLDQRPIHKTIYKTKRNSSETSSIMADSEGKTCSFFILILAVVFQFLSVITICVTFIFPFWSFFKINLPNGTLTTSGYLNITNAQSSISLIAPNLSSAAFPIIKNPDQVKFDMGLWNLRTYRKLAIYDLTNINMVSENIQSMLWTTGNIKTNSFVYMFMSLIDLTSSTIFALQILEILHLIFVLLTFCGTSVTLCLCTNKKASIAWYLVCYLLCLLSLLLGLSVIIVLVAWQTSVMPPIVSTQNLTLMKGFGFCFWLSVVVQALLLSSSFFILTYLIFASCSIYQKHREDSKKILNCNKDSKHSFSNIMRIPRLHVSTSQNAHTHSNIEHNQDINQELPINAFSNANINQYSQQQISADKEQNNSAYVFYTGHGNYHKSYDKTSDYEPPNEILKPQSENLANYSLMIQNHNKNKLSSKKNGNDNHPYSNVLVEQINLSYNNEQR